MEDFDFAEMPLPLLRSVAEEAKGGDRRRALEALRDKIATSIDAANPAHVAGLSRELREILSELQELSDSQPNKGSALDELLNRNPRS